jgi:uncharacterized membrane protein
VLRTIVRRVILTYQAAVYASFAFVLAGFLAALFTDHPVDTKMGSPLELSRHMIELHPAGFFGVGIGIMIVAPILMLADAATTFLRFGDRRYALITGTVTLILAFSILLSFLTG